MDKWFVVLFVLILATTTTNAIYYLNENFEGTWLPTGWGSQSWGDLPQYAYWQQSSDGPWGHYAFGYAEIGATYHIGADLYSCPFSVPAGATFYYCFNYKRINGIYGVTHGQFCIGSPTDPFFTSYIYLIELSQTSQWQTCDGSVVNSSGTNKVAAWRVEAQCQGSFYPADIMMSIDNVRISDQPFTSIEPTSLGSIKAAFK